MMVRCLSIVLCWALVAASTLARDIFVNNVSGSDLNTGTSAESLSADGPTLSIAKAVRMASSGDRIVLARSETPYRECVSLVGVEKGGGPMGPLVLDGQGAVLDGSLPIDSTAWSLVRGEQDVFRFEPSGKGFQSLLLDDVPVSRAASTPGAMGPPHLEPDQWAYAGGFVYFRTSNNQVPQQYPLRYAGHRVGITVGYCQDVMIRNLTIRGFRLDGVNVLDRATDVSLVRVNSVANGRSGVFVHNGCSARLTDCILESNGVEDLELDQHARVEIAEPVAAPEDAKPPAEPNSAERLPRSRSATVKR